MIWEFAGVDTTSPLDKIATLNSQAASSTPTGAAVSVASAGELIVSVAEVQNSVTGIASGNAFTSDSTMMGNGWAHLIASSAGTYSPQWNQDSPGTYDSSTASFKAASSSPNFSVTASPSSQSAAPGTNAVYSITVTPSGGFTGGVSLSATGLPTGASATFNPNSITTSGSSTLTVTTTGSTTPASYSLTITGTSGSLVRTAAATMVVTTTNNACDVNKDGTVNIVDAQVAANNTMSCTGTGFQAFYSQVITGILGSCPVSTGLHTVALNWTASTTTGVTYNIYRATTSGGYNYSAPLATAIASTSFSDCTVALGQTYYYVIRAVDGSGNQSASSAESAVTVPAS